MSRASKESTNPDPNEAAALIAASHKPALLLSDYIADAGSPISTDAGSAKQIEDIAATHHSSLVTRHIISITNGWIVCDGKLLIGGGVDTAWWRGSIRSAEEIGRAHV